MSTKRLPPGQLRSRLAYDHRVLLAMAGRETTLCSYRTSADAHAGRGQVPTPNEADPAQCFVLEVKVPTLVGPRKLSPSTTLRIDASGDGYPFRAPVVWHHSGPMPWNAHFGKGAPVCIGGDAWSNQGTTLIGHLVVHLAKLLNWDEPARTSVYPGYNRAAALYHQEHYGLNRPLDVDANYPEVPTSLLYGDEPAPPASPRFSGRTTPSGSGTTARDLRIATIPSRQSSFRPVVR